MLTSLIVPMLSVLAQDPSMAPAPPVLVPSPAVVEGRWASFEIPSGVRVAPSTEELRPLAHALVANLRPLLGEHVSVATDSGRAGDILLTPAFLPEEFSGNPEAYAIDVFGDHVSLAGVTPAGTARAAARFLQLMEQDRESGVWTVPPVKIVDQPSHAWRGVLLDLARFPHSVESIEEALNLAFLFSVNTVHLHLTDDQAFTFPASCLPPRTDPGVAGPDRGYSRDQLAQLVDFAAARGIDLIPEIDMPSHSSALVRARPDLFGTVDEDGQPKSTGVVNMASERAYGAIEGLLAEVAGIFVSSPVIHVGGDEVWAPHLVDVPEFADFAAKHGLPPTAEEGAIGELLNHFLVRVTGMVRELGRRPAVWEGFHPTGVIERRLGKDVLVMSWSQATQTPEELVEQGYSVLNCGWDPLYIVPAQGWATQPERAFEWAPNSVRQRFGGREANLEPGAPLAGAQICVWEQRPDAIVPGLLRVLPELSERMWASGNTPGAWEGFRPAAEASRNRALRILRPVRVRAKGTYLDQGTAFESEVEVTLDSNLEGDLVYAFSETLESPIGDLQIYTGEPIAIDRSQVLHAYLTSPEHGQIGGVTKVRFECAPAVWDFSVFALPPKGKPDWDAVFAQKPIGSGVLLAPTPERIAAINREQFAKVNPTAHVDTRPLAWSSLDPLRRIDPMRSRLWGRHAMRMAAQVRINKTGEWTLKVGTRGGAARVYMGGELVLECGSDKVEETLALEVGVYEVEVHYAMLAVHDDLQALLTAPSGPDPVPLVPLLLPLAERVPNEELLRIEN